MQWFPLQVLVLTFVCFHGALRTAATVVTDFKDLDKCVDSFYDATPPTGMIDPSKVKICQTLGNEARFVTVYDRERRIPVFSAYRFERPGGNPDEEFDAMQESQLAYNNANGNMERFPAGPLDETLENSQAVPEDYSSSALHKILHLNPITHQSGQENRKAAFALTNAVPQISTLTAWKEHEEKVRDLLDKYCLGTAYVITGVTGGADFIRREGKDRVGIPENLWSAYCCDKINPEAPEDIRQRLPAQGAYFTIGKGQVVEEMSVPTLEEKLKSKLVEDQSVQMFHNNCISSL